MSRKIRPVAKKVITYGALHLFAGIGGGALGFQDAAAKVAGVEGRFETIVGIDVDRGACDDFEMLTGAPSACIDLFTREQYVAFHSTWKRIDGEWVATKLAEVPAGWEEATPQTIRDACRGRAPDVVFLSPPCKGLSGLLSGKLAGSPKYQALNDLVCRGLWLVSEAFKDDPPRLIILENVPRIQTRGRALIDRNIAMLSAYGYATQEGRHNCGKIGNMAQSRERFFFIARRCESVEPFLYQPPEHPLRAMGEEVLKLPLPFDPAAGPMHRLSEKMQISTWVRLALIRGGRDWRDLKKWAPGTFRIDGTRHNNVFRVVDTTREPSPTVTAGGGPSSGGLCMVDPRLSRDGFDRFVVQDIDTPARTVTCTVDVQSGAPSLIDPRMSECANRHHSKFRVDSPDLPAHTVTGARVGSGTISTIDPRLPPSEDRHSNSYRVTDPAGPSGTVVTSAAVGSGLISTVDPRMSLPDKCVTLRVKCLTAPAPTVASRSSVWDSAGFSAIDPRPGATYRNGTLGMADLDEPCGTVIAAADTWATGDNASPDPRPGRAAWNDGAMGALPLGEPAGTGCGSSRPTNGAFSTVDPRPSAPWNDAVLGVADGDKPIGTVCARSGPTNGTFSTVDPRPSAEWNGGVFGVAEGDRPIGAVCARSTPTNGAFSVADVRDLAPLPDFWPDTVPVLLSPHDGMMHRPLTILELAVLQGLPARIDGKPLVLSGPVGRSAGKWRGRIGNMVPPPAAKAIATEMLKTLLSHDTRHPLLGFTPIWVSPGEWYEPDAPARLEAFRAAGAMGAH